ncbi:putative LRR containing protein [Trachipleistophora hominis]|uniref:Putative LRR containing protein n=1 Tax=Trachipleistophora hominis TaxID=72359 RepID=L7JV71_TRAHO|nr:putative LRR containing protein [Trachipleistophora hominis]
MRTQNNLETLELFGFQLSESNANLLNEFVVLTKICVSYEMIDAKFLLSMFSNIRKLDIHRDLNMSDHFAENIVLCNEQCIKLLGELKCTE